MSGFQVRPSTPADLDAIVEGFARACAKPPASVAAKIRWALGANPAGSSGVVAADARGRLIGHLGVTHVPMLVEGAAAAFGRICASWVDPLFRTAGVHSAFAEIDDAFRETVEGKTVAAAYGAFADGDWWTLRRMREFFPVRTEVVLHRPAAPHHPGPARVETVAATPDALDGWSAALDLGPCGARRDGATLLFRLGGPWASDEGWLARRERTTAGVAIVRPTQAARVVLDLAAPEDDEESARALFDRAIGDGSTDVILGWFSRSPWFLLAQRLGFRVAPTDSPYLAFRGARGAPEPHWLMDRWNVAPADVGLHPLPPMLAPEETVTSAPIGTSAGRERHV